MAHSFQEPFLAEIHREVERSREEVQAEFGRLSRAQLSWSVDDESWSVGQCLDHLVTADRLYLEEIAGVVDRGRRNGRTRQKPFRGGWFGRWFARMVGPSVKMKVTAPKVFRPSRIGDVENGVVERYLDTQDRLLRALEKADGLDLDRLRIVSPVSRLFRFRLGDGFRIVVEHDKRHLAQARRVISAAGFPAEEDGA